MIRGVLAVTLALAVGGSALAGSANDDLATLSNREYVDYVHDRFEWLTGEGRSSHHLAEKFHRQCKPSTTDADAARACEIAKAADEQSERVVQEGRELLLGLQHRMGGVPPWARNADALLEASVGKQPQPAQQQHP